MHSQNSIRKLLLEALLRLCEYAESHSLEEVIRRILDEAELLTASKIGICYGIETYRKNEWLRILSTATLQEWCSFETQKCHYPFEEADVWLECLSQGHPILLNDFQRLECSKELPLGYPHLDRVLLVPVVRAGMATTSYIIVGNKEADYEGRDLEILSNLVSMSWNIVDRKHGEDALRESERRLKSTFLASPLGIGFTSNRIITDTNEALCKITGYSQMELLGKSARILYPDDAEFEYAGGEKYREIGEKGVSTVATRWLRKDGNVINICLSSSPLHVGDISRGVTFSALDITACVRMEAYGDMDRETMRILNQPGELQDLIRQVVTALKGRIGLDTVSFRLHRRNEAMFDAVGIRLQDGEDFPYFVQEGFPKDFLVTENSLIERSPEGGVCRDKDGNVSLECTCGLVLSGKTDPDNPLFTPGGSCWTNNSFPLLDIPSDEDPRHHPRNQCIHQGYASVALIPIRGKDRIIGLLQFNDRRQGQFTLDSIEHLERIALHIGTALTRLAAEKALRKERQRLAAIISSSNIGTWEWNIQSGETIFNERWAEIIGYSLREISPITVDTWKKFAHPVDMQTSEELLEKHFKGELQYYEHETRMKHKDGSWAWVIVRGKVTTWAEDGAPLLMQGTLADISHRKQTERELRAALSEKEVLLREVHHRVKNNLAAIIGLLNVQQKNIVDERAVASFQELADRVLSMALVHERLYRSDDISRIALQDYLEDLISHLLPAYGAHPNIRFHADASEVEIGLDLAIPLGLIVNELVTNALKYAFPKGKSGNGSESCEISILMHAEKDNFTLTVADNGVGLPAELDWRTCPSLGMHLVRMLGEHQLGGKIELDHAEGLRFVLRFKDRLKKDQDR